MHQTHLIQLPVLKLIRTCKTFSILFAETTIRLNLGVYRIVFFRNFKALVSWLKKEKSIFLSDRRKLRPLLYKIIDNKKAPLWKKCNREKRIQNAQYSMFPATFALWVANVLSGKAFSTLKWPREVTWWHFIEKVFYRIITLGKKVIAFRVDACTENHAWIHWPREIVCPAVATIVCDSKPWRDKEKCFFARSQSRGHSPSIDCFSKAVTE